MSDKFNNIDDLLKEMLNDYGKKPSSSVWQKVSIRLWLRDKIYWIIIPLLLLLGASAYFIFTDTKSEFNTIEQTSQSGNNISNSTSDLINKEPVTNNKHDSKNTIISKNNENNPILQSNETRSNTNKDINPPKEIKPGKKVVPSLSLTNQGKKDDFANHSYENYLESKSEMGSTDLFKSAKMDFIPFYSLISNNLVGIQFPYVNPRNQYQIYPKLPEPVKKKRGQWLYGLYVVPEMIFTQNENNDKKQSIAIEATGIYTIDDFYLQLGTGVGLSTDKGKFNIDYSQFDSIGYYHEVTSFIINPQTGQPDFKTEISNVYDTVYYNTSENTDNLYTYLRFPLYAGFNIHKTKNLVLSVKAGGVYSILINSRESNYSFKNDEATWINIVDKTHKRVNSNFQLSISFGAALRLKENLSLSFEPAYNYYFNNIYVNGVSVKTPWSISLRVGIIIKL